MSAFIPRHMEHTLHLNRLLLGANQTFADATNFSSSLSLSRCSTWPLGSWFLRRKLNWNKSQTNSLLQKWLQETCFFKWYKWQERYAIQLSKREISTILRMWTKFVTYHQQCHPLTSIFAPNNCSAPYETYANLEAHHQKSQLYTILKICIPNIKEVKFLFTYFFFIHFPNDPRAVYSRPLCLVYEPDSWPILIRVRTTRV